MNHVITRILIATLATAFAACSASTDSVRTTDGTPESEVANQEGVTSLGVFTSGAEGFDTRSYYYDTGEEVVVFGAQFTPELASDMLAQIRSETDSPVRYVVALHPNPDKFNGATVFQREGADFVASAATAQALATVHAYKKAYFVEVAGMFTEETYPELPSPDITFEETLVLDLEGGATVTLEVLEHSGVSTTQTVAYLDEEEVLIVGDLVHHGVHSWLEGGIVDGAPRPDLGSWRQALEELREYPASVEVYGGRGEHAPLEEALSAQDAYLARVIELRTAYLRDHAGPYDSEDHAALASAIRAEFPELGLEYMVDYSVYGLFLVTQ